MKEIEQVPNTYYYDKLYDDKHLGSFTENIQIAQQLGWQDNAVAITDTEVSDVNGWTYLKGYAPQKTESMILIVQSRITEIQSAVQNLLDSKAQEKNYDNGFAIASYANSTDTIFHAEANRFIAWRDTCWRECYNILAQFQNGEIEMPTVAYVLERLPSLEW